MAVKLPVEFFCWRSAVAGDVTLVVAAICQDSFWNRSQTTPIHFLCRPEASNSYNFDFSCSAAFNLLSR